jgi:hypothetical protein
MNIYKLIGVIAIASVLGTACKKDETKNVESTTEIKKPELSTEIKNDNGQATKVPGKTCYKIWYDWQGNGHYGPTPCPK